MLEQNMAEDANSQPLNQNGVDRLVNELYQLKHFGQDLQAVKQTVLAAHEAQNREIPYIMKRQNSSWSLPFQSFGRSLPVNGPRLPSDLANRGNSSTSRRERDRQGQNQSGIGGLFSRLRRRQ